MVSPSITWARWAAAGVVRRLSTSPTAARVRITAMASFGLAPSTQEISVGISLM
jgi:hypothetical protein